MCRPKNYYLVIDTETVGDITHPIAYDVGGLVCDRNGTIYDSFHFLVREVFADLTRMSTAYYANKFAGYLDRLSDGTLKAKPFGEIIAHIDNLCDKWNIKYLCAYNLAFDLRSMGNTCEWLFENRNWLNHPLEPLCIWGAACDVLYGKKFLRAAAKNNWYSEKGNVKTSAEVGYRYISKNNSFEEEHRGLDDCEIESKILAAIFAQHRPFNGKPVANPYRKVWAKAKKPLDKNPKV